MPPVGTLDGEVFVEARVAIWPDREGNTELGSGRDIVVDDYGRIEFCNGASVNIVGGSIGMAFVSYVTVTALYNIKIDAFVTLDDLAGAAETD